MVCYNDFFLNGAIVMLAEVTAEPLYEKVKRHLAKYIEENKPAVLPREQELMETFGVSRNTLRRSVFELTKDGILKPVQGCGTMVVKYAGLTSCDIGIIITDSVKLTDPWIAGVIESFRNVALAEGYHLNLFMCHDYSLAPSTNSVFRYLASSHRLSGLLMLSALNEEEMQGLRKHNIPIVTSDFCYVNTPVPFVGFDLKYAIDTVLERCCRKNIERIACVSYRMQPRTAVPCIGRTDIFIEGIRNFVEKYKFPQYPIPIDSLIEEQLCKLYEMEPEKRPELLVVGSLKERESVNAFLMEHGSWNPILINPYMAGEKISGYGIVYNPKLLGVNAFKLLKKNSGDDMTEQGLLAKPELFLDF